MTPYGLSFAVFNFPTQSGLPGLMIQSDLTTRGHEYETTLIPLGAETQPLTGFAALPRRRGKGLCCARVAELLTPSASLACLGLASGERPLVEPQQPVQYARGSAVNGVRTD